MQQSCTFFILLFITLLKVGNPNFLKEFKFQVSNIHSQLILVVDREVREVQMPGSR